MRFSLISLMMIGLSSGTAWAGSTSNVDSVSCGLGAIEIGMTPADIKKLCGESWQPTFSVEHVRPRKNGEEDIFYKWLVHQSGMPQTHVILKNGEVVKIFIHDPKIQTITAAEETGHAEATQSLEQ